MAKPYQKEFREDVIRVACSREPGVNRSTLYNSFDGKEGLFHAAFESYLADVEATLIAPFRDGTQGLEDLVAFTERQRLPLTDPTLPPGCLLVNAMVTGELLGIRRKSIHHWYGKCTGADL